MRHQPDYLLHLIGWVTPVLAGQWAIGGRTLRRFWRPMAVAVASATAYLTAVDAIAIEQGIWGFGEEHLTGWRLGPVPIEEALFFAMTALLVCQGFLLIRYWARAPDPV